MSRPPLRAIATITALLSLYTIMALPAQAPAAPTSAALDSIIAAQMGEAGIMGLGAAIIIRGKVVWS
ncbi:MAG: hypothetical protein H0W15_03730, partial [Gemmatimonadales bacterium]|nr:hypothetical protein [Gemmatimonadales bacterium]